MKQKRQRGFTLIELLVVIAIIGLLASIILVALNGARQKSRDATRLADVKEISTAMEAFYNDASSYPTGTGYTSGSGALLGTAQLLSVTSKGTFNFTPGYLGTIPMAPLPADLGCVALGTNSFTYLASTDGTTYTLTFCLGGATGGYNAGTHTLTPYGIK